MRKKWVVSCTLIESKDKNLKENVWSVIFLSENVKGLFWTRNRRILASRFLTALFPSWHCTLLEIILHLLDFFSITFHFILLNQSYYSPVKSILVLNTITLAAYWAGR